jgi:hypothetical protein
VFSRRVKSLIETQWGSWKGRRTREAEPTCPGAEGDNAAARSLLRPLPKQQPSRQAWRSEQQPCRRRCVCHPTGEQQQQPSRTPPRPAWPPSELMTSQHSSSGGYRRPRAHAGPPGVHSRQADPGGPPNRECFPRPYWALPAASAASVASSDPSWTAGRGAHRGNHHLRGPGSPEDEVLALPAEAAQHQPQPGWSVALPRALQDLLADRARVSSRRRRPPRARAAL